MRPLLSLSRLQRLTTFAPLSFSVVLTLCRQYASHLEGPFKVYVFCIGAHNPPTPPRNPLTAGGGPANSTASRDLEVLTDAVDSGVGAGSAAGSAGV